MQHSDARPDPDDLSFEELLDAYDDVLWATVRRGIRFARTHDPTHRPEQRDVWTPGGRLVDIKRFVEQRTGAEIQFRPHAYDGEERLVAILNALDADVGSVLEAEGHRAEIEELYLGLRRLERREE